MIYVTHDQIEAMTLADQIVVMHNGHIQQQGTPEELFKKPATKFVAGFIGSPPMNFLNGELVDENGEKFIVGEGFKILLPDDQTKNQLPTNRRVILGIRPSDLHFDPHAPENASLNLKVRVSEYIGAQSVLLCDCMSSSVTVELKSETPVALGGTLRFGLRTEALHLFDQVTEQTI